MEGFGECKYGFFVHDTTIDIIIGVLECTSPGETWTKQARTPRLMADVLQKVSAIDRLKDSTSNTYRRACEVKSPPF